MNIRVKKQHYVWEFYLKSWATENQIWCKRNGKIFSSSTENVAQQRYFYEVEPLSQSEIKLITSMLRRGPAINQFSNQDSLKTYILVANSQGDLPRFGIEQYHGMIETNALPVLTALRAGNTEVLNDKQCKIHLCIYLGHQYTRTKKMKNAFAARPENFNIQEEYKSCDLNKIYNAMMFIYANGIGSSICDHLDLRLVKNESEKKLITSDQPIYNLLAISGEMPKEISIYFPISPELALWATKRPNEEKIYTNKRVDELNHFMASNAHEYIFALNEEELKNIEVA